MIKRYITSLILSVFTFLNIYGQIDRHALLERNTPIVTRIDSLESLSVGNGNFCFTVDPTGLQTFPELYANGVPLGTMSNWGWHYNENKVNCKFTDVLEEYDFGHGHKELYAGQGNKDAANYFRENPHRLHLGTVGFYGIKREDIKDIHQVLNLEEGVIVSTFTLDGKEIKVETVCDPWASSQIAVRVDAGDHEPLPIIVRMPYPTGKHSDDACDWSKGAEYHETIVMDKTSNAVWLKHTFPPVHFAQESGGDRLYDSSYQLGIYTDASLNVERNDANTYIISADRKKAEYMLDWKADVDARGGFVAFETIKKRTADTWHDFWYDGAAVDFSQCTDPRAKELERRVVLSQYLLAINSSGSVPPQETGLTYNSWFGKFHLEMIWWHQAWLALWGHPELLHRTLQWYLRPNVHDIARYIAQRQGFKGVRWMKMTDPSGLEAPSKVGSFLIWNQPHIIHLAELLRRCEGYSVVKEFGDVVDETAQFMADFTTYDKAHGRYLLKGYIPAQETLKASEVVNSPFELSQWHLCMNIANDWLRLGGKKQNKLYADITKRLSHLAGDSLYLAAETAHDTYSDPRFTQDHMAVLGALGIYPKWAGIDEKKMLKTLLWIQDNWNWDKTWGWDHPMTAMCATRLHRPDLVLKSLLAPHRTNTYLLNGHNYQDSRLRIYLPGNGALLQCIALMCAGWDGCNETNPGFPKDGTWNVRWEGLKTLP